MDPPFRRSSTIPRRGLDRPEPYNSGRRPPMHVLSTLAFAAVVLSAPAPGQQDHQHANTEKLGTVRFATSCTPAAQPAFARAMALLHSFEFAPAIESFTAAEKADPGCAIAEWGIALSRWGNPFAAGIKPPALLEAGRAAIEQGERDRRQDRSRARLHCRREPAVCRFREGRSTDTAPRLSRCDGHTGREIRR